MWDHFGGTLTLKSDDGGGRVVEVDTVDTWHMSVYARTCWTQLHVGKNYGWTTWSVRLGKNCAIAPALLMLLLVGNV